MRRNKVLTTLAAVSMSALMAVTTVAPAVPALADEQTNDQGQEYTTVDLNSDATKVTIGENGNGLIPYAAGTTEKPDIYINGKAVKAVFVKDAEEAKSYDNSGYDVAVIGWTQDKSVGEHEGDLTIVALKNSRQSATNHLTYIGTTNKAKYTVTTRTLNLSGARLSVAASYHTDEKNLYAPKLTLPAVTENGKNILQLTADVQVVVKAYDGQGHVVATTVFDQAHQNGTHVDGQTGDNAPSYAGNYRVVATLKYADGKNAQNSNYYIAGTTELTRYLQVLPISRTFSADVNSDAQYGTLPTVRLKDGAEDGTQTTPRRVYFKLTRTKDGNGKKVNEVKYARYDFTTKKLVLVSDAINDNTRNTDAGSHDGFVVDNIAQNTYDDYDLPENEQVLLPGTYSYSSQALANGKVDQSDLYSGNFTVAKAPLDQTEIYPAKFESRDGWKTAYSVNYSGDVYVLHFRASTEYPYDSAENNKEKLADKRDTAAFNKYYKYITDELTSHDVNLTKQEPALNEDGSPKYDDHGNVVMKTVDASDWKVTVTGPDGKVLSNIDAIQNVGTYNVTVSASSVNDLYTGSAKPATFTVGKLNQVVSIYDAENTTYNGKAYAGKNNGGFYATAQTDVKLTLTNDATGKEVALVKVPGTMNRYKTAGVLHAGTYTLTAATNGNINYNAASTSKKIVVSQAQFKGAIDNDVDGKKTYLSYDGDVQLPVYTVVDQFGNTLTNGTDYTVSADDGYDNKSAKEQYNKVTLNKDGDFYTTRPGVYTFGKAQNTTPEATSVKAGQVDTRYTIAPLALAPFADAQQARFSDATYDGKKKNPADYLTVRAIDGKVIPASDYTVEPTGDTTKPGTYKVTVKGNSKNVTGYTIQDFTINQDAVKTAENNQKAAEDLIKTLEESNKTSKDALDQAQKALDEAKKQTEEAKNQSKAQQQIADNTKKDAVVKTQNVYRVYNPNSGEHLYTTSKGEVNSLAKLGWRDEGIGWKGLTAETGKPVYRLYNKNGGEHFYTLSLGEKNNLVKHGWRDEGIAFYAADQKNGVAVYRQYNKNQFANNHNFTTNDKERAHLVNIGWKDEGVAWYAAK